MSNIAEISEAIKTLIASGTKKSGYRLLGDVAFNEVSKKSEFITFIL